MEELIKKRMEQLDSLIGNTRYAKQKTSLQIELQAFLARLSTPKTLDTALPREIRSFLIFKEYNGKTKVHSQECRFRGSKVKSAECTCPLRCAAKSVDSVIGKLRAIFRDYGRGTDWCEMLGTGNPAAAPLLRKHLASVQLEHEM